MSLNPISCSMLMKHDEKHNEDSMIQIMIYGPNASVPFVGLRKKQPQSDKGTTITLG